MQLLETSSCSLVDTCTPSLSPDEAAICSPTSPAGPLAVANHHGCPPKIPKTPTAPPLPTVNRRPPIEATIRAALPSTETNHSPPANPITRTTTTRTTQYTQAHTHSYTRIERQTQHTYKHPLLLVRASRSHLRGPPPVTKCLLRSCYTSSSRHLSTASLVGPHYDTSHSYTRVLHAAGGLRAYLRRPPLSLGPFLLWATISSREP